MTYLYLKTDLYHRKNGSFLPFFLKSDGVEVKSLFTGEITSYFFRVVLNDILPSTPSLLDFLLNKWRKSAICSVMDGSTDPITGVEE